MNKTARANPSTAQTNAPLVAATDNLSIVVKSVYISADTAMTVTILNSATHDVLWRQYVGANGGTAVPAHFRSRHHEGLDYSTSVEGNVFILVEYDTFGSVD